MKELEAYVWRRLGVRKHLAGRETVNELTRLAVENWQTEYLRAAKDENEIKIVEQGMLASVKRMHEAVGNYGSKEYGFIWIFLFQALASAVIQIIVKWWLESNANKIRIEAWRKEMLP
jgi:hypothetical protein